ncbi:MAG: beta-lactamase family protein [Spirochaetales bacterium]|nr:beta-lactamase family protein [Spirochaetales bacterium]
MSDSTILTGETGATPKEAGYYPPNIERLDTFFTGLIKEEKLQCASYLLARYGKIFAHKSMGRLLPYGPDTPFRPDSIRLIASTTKVFTAVGILQLAEKGKLTLDQPVSDFIKEFDTDMHRKISIFHLLTHTSGLAPDPGFYLEPYPVYKNVFKDMDALIRYTLSGAVHSKPGERWAYSTRGMIMLGEVIKRVSNMEYEDYIQKNILDPLGMTDSHFIVPPEKRDRVCFTKEPDKTIREQKELFNAGGGLYSTLNDLFRFGQMMLNNGQLDGVRIVSRKSVETMISSHLKNVPADAWEVHQDDKKHGLGWSLEYRSIVTPGTYGHEGAGRVNLIVDPAEELVAVYFVPTTIEWVPESLICPMAIIWSGLE